MSEFTDKLGHLDGVYKRLMRDVKELSGEAENAILLMPSSMLLRTFDELVQYIALCVSSTCGEYREYDNKIIRGIASRGDLLDAYNEIEVERGGKLILTWEGLYRIMSLNGTDGAVAGLVSLAELVYDRSAFMIKALAPIACMHYESYFYNIVKKLYRTVAVFIDLTTPRGALEEIEAKADMAKNVISTMLIKPWMLECEAYCNDFLKSSDTYERVQGELKKIEKLDILYDGENDNEND
jgi:hypothetical protein